MALQTILTSRLMLVPSTLALLSLELSDMTAFANSLRVSIPEDWPPGEYDRDAIQFFIEKLRECGAEAAGWYGWYAIREATQSEPATLIGGGGYMGPPDASDCVEIGYSISERWRGQGLATELVTALVDNAMGSGTTKIVAHTHSDNPASIAVLLRCGFLQAPSTIPDMLQFDYSHIS